ncbi:putative holliday junction resolvase [Spirosomataceae bacterium TFI 002]|nr:putative holliday junction resolvase [Spirosomataceae bacterium TFI 002]
MARILAIDYGKKRTGLAVTDPLQIIASSLTTVETHQLNSFLKEYFAKEEVEKVVIGLPTNLDGTATDGTPLVESFLSFFKKNFTTIPIETIDERFTSKMAKQTMIDSGMKKKDRQNKGNVDMISATIILQDYLRSMH